MLSKPAFEHPGTSTGDPDAEAAYAQAVHEAAGVDTANLDPGAAGGSKAARDLEEGEWFTLDGNTWWRTFRPGLGGTVAVYTHDGNTTRVPVPDDKLVTVYVPTQQPEEDDEERDADPPRAEIVCCDFRVVSDDPGENSYAFTHHQCRGKVPILKRGPTWHESLFSGPTVWIVAFLCFTAIVIASIVNGDWSWLPPRR